MTSLHTVRKSLVIALAVIGMGSALAAAAPEGRHGQAAHQEQSQEQRQAKWAERSAKRQAALHDSLKLSAVQEPAWAAFVAGTGPKAHRTREERGAWAGLSAPARMEKRLAMAKEHIAAMETRLTALNRFYAVLTPEQKKLFDANSMRGGHGMRHGQHRRHGQHKMPG